MTILTQASKQWATRPNDERFLSLIDLHEAACRFRERSAAKVISSRAIRAIAEPNDKSNSGLLLVGPNGVPVAPSNWAFGQLANRAGAPAGYLRSLPAALAADNINYGLHHLRDVEEVGVLLNRNDDDVACLSAVTGPNYGRIWNATVTKALVDHYGDGRTGNFRIPGEFGKPVPVTKENTTLYCGDRDMFVFLADEVNRVEVPNRRNGQSGLLAQGFFFWNSEQGSSTLGMARFFFDYACRNRIVWGAEGYEQITLRHTAGAPDRWIEQVIPTIERSVTNDGTKLVTMVKQAQAARVDNVEAFLKTRQFTGAQVSAIKAAHMSDEQRPMETLWDISTGITAHARGISFQDDRVKLEREAGKILNLAA